MGKKIRLQSLETGIYVHRPAIVIQIGKGPRTNDFLPKSSLSVSPFVQAYRKGKTDKGRNEMGRSGS